MRFEDRAIAAEGPLVRESVSAAAATEGVLGLACATIFLISLAALLLETSLVRIFSVTLFSPFAFMIVSSALFGIGLGGVYVMLLPSGRSSDPEILRWRCCHLSAGFALSVIAALTVILKIPFQIGAVTTELSELLALVLHYAAMTLPFFFAGALIALLLTSITESVNRLYFFDLAGAGLGALLAIPLFPLLGGPGIVVVASWIGFSAAIHLATRQGPLRFALQGLAVLAAAYFLTSPGWLEVSSYETKREFGEDVAEDRIIYSEWNAISRVDVSEQENQNRRKIFIDGGTYVSVMLPFDGDFARVREAKKKSWFLPYLLKDDSKSLVIGSGGGREVLVALAYGARSVTAVELDPIIADIVQDEFDSYVGGLFTDPRVHLVHDEGRSFVQRSGETFDVIQQVNNNSPIAMASGALNLSETYLLTAEAFHDYLDHLAPGGILAVNRGGAVKLTALARRTFDERGITDAPERVVVLSGDESADDELFLLKKGAFTQDELDLVRRFAADERLDVLYGPETQDGSNLHRRILTASHPDDVIESLPLNLSPPTDDQPFFNHMRKWSEGGIDESELPPELKNLVHEKTAHLPFDGGDMVLFVLLGEAAVLSALFILLPLYVFERRGSAVTARGRILGYFGALGLAFILVEISLMQRFVLFLGYPIYAITMILFSLLVFAGVGSFLSARFLSDPRGHLVWILGAVGTVLITYVFVLPAVFELFLARHFAVRYLVSLVLLLPLGMLMGMPFPLGIRIVDRISPQAIPWAWGINGYATVIGSVLSVILAMALGFDFVLLIAAALYFGALAVIATLRPSPHAVTTFTIAIAIGIVSAPSGAEAKACGGSTPCACGDDLRASATLARNLGPCPDEGLRIRRDGVVLDCHGFTITGSGEDDGIVVDDVEGAVVRNCRVTRFRHGIRVREGRNNRIAGNDLVANTRYGLDLAVETTGNRIEQNRIADSGDEGIHVGTGSDRNVLAGNEIRDSGKENLYLLDSAGHTVTGNTMSGAGSAEIYAKHLVDTLLADNAVLGGPIQIRGRSYGNELVGNELVDGGYVFQAYDDPKLGWTHPHRNEIRGGSVSDVGTCFRFEGAYDNRVMAVAVEDCKLVKSSKRGGLRATGNVIDVER